MLRIAHLADIHIQDRRRAEYAAVFARLYDSLRRAAPTLIVVAGDVFDNKMRASPHNLEDVAAFLSALADIAPVVLIAGNHDTNCLAPGSLDLLTPLVAEHRALQPPRLTYWRSSGVYAAHGCAWTVIATDGGRPAADEERAAIEAAGLAAAPHICLFHSEVNGALMPNGTQMRDFKLSAAAFEPYDLALGGHIHLRQLFAPRAAYCGSLIQQNIGEPHHRHGYVLWELEASSLHPPHRTAPPRMQGVDIPNEKGFVRVEVDAAGRDVTPRPAPAAPHYWELVHDEDAPPALVAALAAEREAAYGMPPRAVRPRPRGGEAPAAAPAPTDEHRERASLANAQLASRQLEAHEAIIRELLAEDEHVEAVLALHRARWCEPAAQAAGGKFRLLRLEFDNMYAFGPANVVDFTALEGCISGVVAPNHTGKSSLIEALVFALYEDHPRAPTKKDVIHRGAGSCRLVLDFELDGRPGRIAKGFLHGHSNKGGSQYRFEYAGEDRTRGGTAETLAEIEGVLGGAINALASSFQLQGGELGGFIGTSAAGRKKLIASAMALGSFEALERSTAKELTECGGEVRALAAQHCGASAEAIAASLASVVGRGAAAAALAAELEGRAAAAARVAADAERALGVELGRDAGVQRAAHDAGAAADAAADAASAGAMASGADSRLTLEGLAAALGPLAPEEEAAGAARPAWQTISGDIPAPEAIAVARRGAAAAAETASAEMARAVEARVAAAVAAAAVAADEIPQLAAAARHARERLDREAAARPAEPNPPAAPRPQFRHDADAHAAGVFLAGPPTRPRAADRASAIDILAGPRLTPDERALAARWDPGEFARLEQQRSLAANGLCAAAPSVPEPPDQPRPGAAPEYSALGTRSGPPPTEAAVAAAEAVWRAAAPYDALAAARWQPAEFARLAAAMGDAPTTPSGQTRVVAMAALDAARATQAAAARELAQAAQAAAALNAAEAELADVEAAPGAAATVEVAAAALQASREWAAAVAHAATIRARLQPREGCAGCAHACQILNVSPDGGQAALRSAQAVLRAALAAAGRRAVAAAEATEAAASRAAEVVVAAEAALRRAAAKEAAQKRLDELAAARSHHEAAAAQAAAVAVLETANHWRTHALRAWELYDARVAQAAAEAAHRALLARQEADARDGMALQVRARALWERMRREAEAIAIMEAANGAAAADWDAWEAYERGREAWLRAAADGRADEAAQALASAEAQLAAAECAALRADAAQRALAAAACAQAAAAAEADRCAMRAKELAELRRAAASALAWWRAARRAADDAAALRVMRASAAAASAESVSAARRAAEGATHAAAEAQAAARGAAQEVLTLQREEARLRRDLDIETARAAQHRAACARQAALKAYRAVLRPAGGIGDRLLDRGRAALARQVGAALRELGAQFTADIGADYSVSIRCGSEWLPASLGSGYQRFVLSLAARLAIWRLSTSPRPDAFVVDEGFGACDEDYLEAMATALEALAAAPGGPRLVFVVSHVDALKTRLERTLEIEMLPTGSRITNSAASRLAPAPRLAQRARRAADASPAGAAPADGPGELDAGLRPDPDNPSNVYCPACRQSLRAAWAARHLVSAKHAAALARQ
jgi:hypothetical protein